MEFNLQFTISIFAVAVSLARTLSFNSIVRPNDDDETQKTYEMWQWRQMRINVWCAAEYRQTIDRDSRGTWKIAHRNANMSTFSMDFFHASIILFFDFGLNFLFVRHRNCCHENSMKLRSKYYLNNATRVHARTHFKLDCKFKQQQKTKKERKRLPQNGKQLNRQWQRNDDDDDGDESDMFRCGRLLLLLYFDFFAFFIFSYFLRIIFIRCLVVSFSCSLPLITFSLSIFFLFRLAMANRACRRALSGAIKVDCRQTYAEHNVNDFSPILLSTLSLWLSLPLFLSLSDARALDFSLALTWRCAIIKM